MASISDPDGPFSARLVDTDDQGGTSLYTFRPDSPCDEAPTKFTTSLPHNSDVLRAVLDYNGLRSEVDLAAGESVEVLVMCDGTQWHLAPDEMQRRA